MPLSIGTRSGDRSDDLAVLARIDLQHAGVLVVVDVGGRVGVELVTVQRLDRDGSVHVVRAGFEIRPLSGLVVAYDATAPLDQPVTYRAQLIHNDDTVSYTSGHTVLVPADPDCDRAWLKPYDQPGLAVPVLTRRVTDYERPSSSETLYVVGRPDPVVDDDVLRTRTLTLSVQTTSAQDGRRLLALLAARPTLLVQAAAAWQLDGLWCKVVRVVETHELRYSGGSDRTFDLQLVEVAEPAPRAASLVVPGQEISRDEGTWADLPGTFRAALLGTL